MDKKPAVPIGLRLPDDLHHALTEEAAKSGISKNRIISASLLYYLSQSRGGKDALIANFLTRNLAPGEIPQLMTEERAEKMIGDAVRKLIGGKKKGR